MAKKLNIDNRERDVFYIDAREFDKNKDENGYSRGSGILQYFYDFKESNKKFAKKFRDYDESNIETGKNLPNGDVLHNDVCCEIKEYNSNDLFDSAWSERLPRQSHELFNLRDKKLYKHPLKDCRILIMAGSDGYNHIHNLPSVYKGLLNFSGETPVNFVNYTTAKKYKGNQYVHLADTIMHLFGMNGDQIGRQSHASMVKNNNPAVNYLMSLDVFTKPECKKITKSENLYSWNDAYSFLNEANDLKEIYTIFLNNSTKPKAESALIKIYGRKAVKEAFA